MNSISFTVETKQVVATKKVDLQLPVCLKNDFSSSQDEHCFVYIDAQGQATLVTYDLIYHHYKVEFINHFDLYHNLTDFRIQDFPKSCKTEEFFAHFQKATKAITARLDAVSADLNQEENPDARRKD